MIGRRIRAARIALGYTQERLALKTRIPRMILSGIEMGHLQPSPEALAQIEAALGVDPGLLGRPDLGALLDSAAR